MHIWIEVYGREYWVFVNGTLYDKMFRSHGPKLRRDDLKDIADGYREALTHYDGFNQDREGSAGRSYLQDVPRWKK